MKFLADIIFFFSRKNVVSLCSVYALASVSVIYFAIRVDEMLMFGIGNGKL